MDGVNLPPPDLVTLRRPRSRARRLGRMLLVLLVLAATGAAAYWWWFRPAAETTEAAAPGGRRGRGAKGDPVAVLAGIVERRDVPIYLEGLGTVQASNTVNIRPMVEGPLLEVGFKEGQEVKAGDVLARIDPRPYQAALDQATAKKRQDEASLRNARLDAGRYAKLAATAYTSAQQADTARAQVAQLEAQVAGDQAQIDSAATQLGYTTVTAPFDGRTGLRQIDVGNIARPGDTTPLTVVTQLRPIDVLFTLPQQALPAVQNAMRNGMPEALAVGQSATGQAGQVLDRGHLVVIDNQVDAATGTIRLKAQFPNADLKLWPGAFVNVRLLADTMRDAVTVPISAIQRGPRGAFVYVVKPDDTVTRRAVPLAFEDQQLAVATSGVKPGEKVVVEGASRLTEGSKVALARPDGIAPDAVPAQRNRQAPGTGGRRRGG